MREFELVLAENHYTLVGDDHPCDTCVLAEPDGCAGSIAESIGLFCITSTIGHSLHFVLKDLLTGEYLELGAAQSLVNQAKASDPSHAISNKSKSLREA